MHDHADQTSLARGLTLPLCFFAALLEGASMQVANATMPKLAVAFPMAADMKTAVLSASVVGIMVGALLGGRIADYLGRKRMLILSMLFYGLILLLSTLAVHPEQLVLLRLLTGIGIGSSMVSSFSLLTENSDPERRGLTLAAMYCGMPLGSGLVRLTALIGIGDWRTPFYVVGGIALLTAPLLAQRLTESSGFPLRADAPRPLAITRALFGGGRAFTTALLWVAFGFMLLAVYLLQGWLPILLVSRGLSRSDAATVQICFNSGAALGALLLGTLLDLPHRWATVAVNYALVMCGLMALLYLEPRLEPMGAAGFLLGASMVGGQATIYILATSSFDKAFRGTGLGTSIAVGRTGSLVGPLVAVGVLNAGVLPVQVLQTLALLVAASGVAALFLVLPREQGGSLDGAGQRAEL